MPYPMKLSLVAAIIVAERTVLRRGGCLFVMEIYNFYV